MRLPACVLGALLALVTAVPSPAQTGSDPGPGTTSPAGSPAPETIDGSQVEDILALARRHGPASLQRQANGDPKISGKIGGVIYQIFFMNCTDTTACEDLNFYAGFLDNKQTLEAINAWNRDKRFGKAYLDAQMDAVIEFDVNLEHGVTRANLEAAFTLWALLLDQYAAHIGFE